MKNLKCIVCNKKFIVHNYREKIAKYCSKQCMGRDKNSEWAKTMFKDGHSAYNVGIHTCKIRYKSLHRDWSNKVRERDNWTCQKCGIKKDNVIAHHPKEWDDYPKLRFNVNNGITLCRGCHCTIHKIKKYE